MENLNVRRDREREKENEREREVEVEIFFYTNPSVNVRNVTKPVFGAKQRIKVYSSVCFEVCLMPKSHLLDQSGLFLFSLCS